MNKHALRLLIDGVFFLIEGDNKRQGIKKSDNVGNSATVRTEI
jgi:hypothetical protein